MFITIEAYFKHMKDLGYLPTLDIQTNAAALLSQIEKFLIYLYDQKYLGLDFEIVLSSGWRSVEYNQFLRTSGQAACANNSAHCTGQAVDIHFSDIIKICEIHPELLKAFDLYAEASKDTPTWTHLTNRAPGSGNRIFFA